jgi:urease subunit beta
VTDGPVPGEVIAAEGKVTINAGRETATVTVGNTGDRPVQVGSHAHFFEVNAALAFDRTSAFGMRLNIPAGTAVRFEPGEEATVELVAVGGERRVTGQNGLTNGSLDDPEAALSRAREREFADADAGGAGGDRS